jgi:ADP-ribose pyrophosphatase YjhB (NUDIX family)
LIVLDVLGRVLLFRHARQSGRNFWAPPGGGVEDDETFEHAASREAFEELGAANVQLRFLWENTVDFVHIGRPVRQREQFFLASGITQTAPAAEVAEVRAREGILEARWWTLTELDAATDAVFPEDLVARLRAVW